MTKIPLPPIPPLDIPFILRQAEIKPSKGLGQNFLSDPNILQKIVQAANITTADRVMEIGPGLGSLTRYLANAAKEVTAIEIDRKLFPILTAHCQHFQNIKLILGDILEFDPAELMTDPGYIVAANIPYYITSAIIRHLLGSKCKPARIVLTVQHEVAQRIIAKAGDMNLLALSVQVYGTPTILFRIPSGAFYPPPTVDSSVVSIELFPEPFIPADHLDRFFEMTRAGFQQKRKTLRNSLSSGLKMSTQRVEELLHSVDIDPMRRAETLSLDEWKKLVQIFPNQ